jgi:hypothetical protein
MMNLRQVPRCGTVTATQPPAASGAGEDENLTAAASVCIDTPSARADASAQMRSRSACSNRHVTRDTRALRDLHAHSLSYVHCSAKWIRWRFMA